MEVLSRMGGPLATCYRQCWLWLHTAIARHPLWRGSHRNMAMSYHVTSIQPQDSMSACLATVQPKLPSGQGVLIGRLMVLISHLKMTNRLSVDASKKLRLKQLAALGNKLL
jgi:hypothetical protein